MEIITAVDLTRRRAQEMLDESLHKTSVQPTGSLFVTKNKWGDFNLTVKKSSVD